MLITIDDIRAAAGSIAGVALRTPLVASTVDERLLVKAESLQPVGAFKLRGAWHAVSSLPAQARAAGVITHSSGNHGQALAYAARRAGIPCVVVIPDIAPAHKIAYVRRLGAEIEVVPSERRLTRALEIAQERGMTLVPPFDDPLVIAGQGTIGLEILDEVTAPAAVLVPVGGGGLASGVASAVKALSPATLVVGVEPELAGDAAQSLASGRLTPWPVEQTARTAADGLRTSLSQLTFDHLSARLDGIVTVTEDEIASSARTLREGYRLVAEPSGAVAPAAWFSRADELRDRFGLGDGPVVAVLSGGNASA
jgi:threonine dehydratase